MFANFLIASVFCFFSLQCSAVKFVLALDPGGLEGGYPQALMLNAFEKEIGRPIAKIFDLIGGTSTGSVLATLLTTKNNAGQPKYSAAEVAHFYETLGVSLFSKRLIFEGQNYLDQFGLTVDNAALPSEEIDQLRDSLAKPSRSIDSSLDWQEMQATLEEYNKRPSLRASVHDDAIFKEMLETYLGTDATLTDLLTPVAIFALKRDGNRKQYLERNLSKFNKDILQKSIRIDQEMGEMGHSLFGGTMDFQLLDQLVAKALEKDALTGLSPIAFRRDQADRNRRQNVRLVDAVMSSSAAASLFLPHQMEYNGTTITGIDGDVPHLSTVWETVKVAKEMWPDEHLVVVTLGLGRYMSINQFYSQRLKEDAAVVDVFDLKPLIDPYLEDHSPKEDGESAETKKSGHDDEHSVLSRQLHQLKDRTKKFMADEFFASALLRFAKHYEGARPQ